MGQRLLQTKLFLPPSRPDWVDRPHLVGKLNAGISHHKKLTLLSAATGFGKTTLLIQWLYENKNVSWLSLDENDNELRRFWQYIVAACRKFGGGIGETSQDLLNAPKLPAFDAWIVPLINDFAGKNPPSPYILVLDDLHLIQNQEILESLEFFLSHQPPQLHAVIASQVDPQLPLAKWRIKGQLSEITAEELRFSQQETAQFIQHICQLPLDANQLDQLSATTEGWIAALKLAAIGLETHANPTAFIQNFTSNNRHLFDYLMEEVLQNRSAETKEFLLHTSFLEKFSPDLCDAVLGRDDSRRLLSYMEKRNLFLIPLDDQREWYRYHHLFADLLGRQLQEKTDRQVGLMPALYNRASQWFAHHNDPDNAIRYAQLAKNWEQAGELMKQFYNQIMAEFGFQHLIEIIERFPMEIRRTQLDLALHYAWQLVMSGRIDDAESWLEHVQPDHLTDEMTGKFCNVRATIASFQGRPTITKKEAQCALEHFTSETNPIDVASATLNLANAERDLSDWDAAVALYKKVISLTEFTDNVSLANVAFSNLGTIQKSRGYFQDSFAIYQKMAQQPSLPHQAQALMMIGTYYYQQNEIETAKKTLLEAKLLADKVSNTHVIVWSARWLARIQHIQGDAYASRLLTHALTTVKSLGMDNYVVWTEAWLAQMWIKEGKLAQANDWVTKILRREADNLTNLHHSLQEGEARSLMQFWLAQKKYTDVVNLANKMMVKYDDSVMGQMEVSLILALVLRKQGKQETALAHLAQALQIAEKGNFVRLFLDVGEEMPAFLQLALTQNITPTFTSKLLAAFNQAPIPPESMVEPLTNRELDVLRLVSAGMSNRETAETLVVTVGTVKKHLNNAFGKLGVSNRTQAAIKAQEMSLI